MMDAITKELLSPAVCFIQPQIWMVMCTSPCEKPSLPEFQSLPQIWMVMYFPL
jgi:hypothetical protein